MSQPAKRRRTELSLLLFDINAVILFHVHQVLLFYALAFAHHFACTFIRMHILSFKTVDTFYYVLLFSCFEYYFISHVLIQCKS